MRVVRGEQLLGEFSGVEVKRQKGSRAYTDTSTRKKVDTSAELANALTDGQEQLAKRRRVIDKDDTRAPLAFHLVVPATVNIEETETKGSNFHVATIAAGFGRELDEQRKQEEEEDEEIRESLLANAPKRESTSEKQKEENENMKASASDFINLKTEALSCDTKVQQGLNQYRRTAEVAMVAYDEELEHAGSEKAELMKKELDELVTPMRTELAKLGALALTVMEKWSFAHDADRARATCLSKKDVTSSMEEMKKQAIDFSSPKSLVGAAFKANVKALTKELSRMGSSRERESKATMKRERAKHELRVDPTDDSIPANVREYLLVVNEDKELDSSVNIEVTQTAEASKAILLQKDDENIAKNFTDHEKLAAIIDEITKMPYYEAQSKWVDKYVKKNQLTESTASTTVIVVDTVRPSPGVVVVVCRVSRCFVSPLQVLRSLVLWPRQRKQCAMRGSSTGLSLKHGLRQRMIGVCTTGSFTNGRPSTPALQQRTTACQRSASPSKAMSMFWGFRLTSCQVPPSNRSVRTWRPWR